MGAVNNREGFGPVHDRTAVAASQFASWRSDPWTTLHRQLVLGNILRHMPVSKSLRVLDVDSDAFYAVELARRGCFVELVASDEEVLERARHQVATEGTAERLRLIRLDADTYLSSYRSASFNAIIGQRLPNRPDYKDRIKQASELLKPHGLLALLCENCLAVPFSLTLKELNPKAALEALAQCAVLPTSVSTIKPEQVNSALETAALQIVGDYGVAIFNDYASEDQSKYNAEFFAALLELERAAALLPHYQGVARYRHVLATRM